MAENTVQLLQSISNTCTFETLKYFLKSPQSVIFAHVEDVDL